jgi:endonuclease YncB( thermonuclease family)
MRRLRGWSRNAPLPVLLTLLIFNAPAFGQGPALEAIIEEVWSGKVAEVRGPNVLVVVYGGSLHLFRLEGIHVPRDQPALAKRAIEMLRERLAGKDVQIRVRGYLEGGQVPLGCVLHGAADVRVDLITQGLTTYCPRHLVEPKLAEAQRLAKRANRGIWRTPSPASSNPCADAA